NLVSRVALALVAARIEPGHLSIELTENILMEQLEPAIGMLNELHALGIGLSLDDFGTGYSSLSHLSSLPIDTLKIDRSFVKDLRPGSNEAAVIRAIVLLGKSLGKEVIAEGIETVAQHDELRALRCDVGQGYLMARPQPPAAIEQLLRSLLVPPAHPPAPALPPAAPVRRPWKRVERGGRGRPQSSREPPLA
ncbi:MAG: EAL domain-containing protein, partial [Ideonella sp.]|nr:EAL domain-containing protein [Ideonella sp.]